MSKNKVAPIGEDWQEYREKMYTLEERTECDLRIAIIAELIAARQNKGFSQKQLESESGVRQPVIARLEKGTTDPQISTVLKVLAPLGKTLAVVPLEVK